MKKTLIALMALGSAALADLESTVLTPMTQDGWTLTSERNGYATNKAYQDMVEGTIYTNDPFWKRPEAMYTFDKSLTLTDPEQSISFSFTMTMNLMQPYNSLASVAFKGSTTDDSAKTIVMGYGGAYSATKNTSFKTAVVNDNSKDVYIFDTTGWGTAYNCTGTATGASLPSAPTSGRVEFATTFSGNIEWSEEKSAFVLNLEQTYGENNYSASYVLGETYSMTGIAIAMDGNSTDSLRDSIKISNMTLTYTTPEPATATLSLLALAGLAARRRRH